MFEESRCELSTIHRRVIIIKPAEQKGLSDGGHAEIVKTTVRRYKLKGGKVMGGAIAASIEPTMHRPKIGKENSVRSRNAYSYRTVEHKYQAATGKTCA